MAPIAFEGSKLGVSEERVFPAGAEVRVSSGAEAATARIAAHATPRIAAVQATNAIARLALCCIGAFLNVMVSDGAARNAYCETSITDVNVTPLPQ